MKKKIHLAQIIADLESFATPPAAYGQIQAVLADATSSVEAITEAVGLDPNISARVLKLANSAFLRRSASVETLGSAIEMVGTERLRDIVLSTMVMEYFRGISPDFVDLEAFWKHSRCCALAARILSSYSELGNPDRCLISGLLHDMGRMVVYLRLPNSAQELFLEYARTNRPLIDLERQLLGFDHAEIGAELLRKWGFAPRVVEAVEFHHDPRLGPEENPDSAIVNLANQIAHAMEYGTSGEMTGRQLNLPAWHQVGLSPAALGTIFNQVEEEMKRPAQTFDSAV
jgi:putative nucleotidyltransferase with HDIG domain